MKYGAASTPEGVVCISWELFDEQGGRNLRLRWREEYEARELGGAAELAFAPGGCRMQLTFPVD